MGSTVRVALTGCSGFIGSYLVRALTEAGHEVVGMVRSAPRAAHIADRLAARVVGTMDDDATLRRLAEAAPCLIHNALDWAGDDPLRKFHSNVLGGYKLLEYGRQAGVNQFLYVSSVSVYHTILPDRRLDAAHPTWPESLYGAFKAALEPVLIAYHHTYGMNTSAYRPSRVYGVADRFEESWWLGLVRQVRRGDAVDTAFGGKIVHVEDLAAGMTNAVGNHEVAGGLFNMVDCYVYDQQVAQMARELTGSGAAIADRMGTGPRHHFDVTRERAVLGVALDRGIAGVREYVGELIDRDRQS